MAIWQFDCEIVPRRWLDRAGLDPDTSLDLQGLPTARWWRDNQPQISVIRFLEERYPRQATADGLCLIWNAGQESRIEVRTEGGSIGRITAIFDVRYPYHDFATAVLELSVLTGAQLHFRDSGRFVEPELETLIAAIGGSEAARYVRNPETEVLAQTA